MAALNEKLRVVVVGGVAGGASAAARVKRLNENADVVVFEKGSDVSFSNCGLPYYLSGTVEDSEDLIMMTPAAFRKKHDIDVRVHSEVVSIDREKKTVTVRSTETGETYEQPYDKLVLSPGANPIVPPALKGADRENVFTIRNVRDIVALKTFLDKPETKRVFVVGGGFIGIEAAAGLEIGKTGAIHVNENYQTNDPDIYAVGDAIEVYDPQTHVWRKLALAGPAQFEARAAADHICGITSPNHGFAGALCLRVFGQNAAAVGISEALAARSGLHADSVLIFPGDKVGIMPDWHYMSLKLIFERPTGLILGAQAIGEGDVVGRMNVIAAMIRMHATVYDLKDMTLCYSPVYSTAKDPVNQAALVAINVLEGQLRQVHVSEVRSLVESGAYIVDVREEGEYAEGHLVGSHNIPLTQLRARMEEIPKDVPVYLHCRSSQRSYYALCCLRGHGYHNLTNISGSFLGISLYEYFHDKSEGRKPIVTAYNFD